MKLQMAGKAGTGHNIADYQTFNAKLFTSPQMSWMAGESNTNAQEHIIRHTQNEEKRGEDKIQIKKKR